MILEISELNPAILPPCNYIKIKGSIPTMSIKKVGYFDIKILKGIPEGMVLFCNEGKVLGMIKNLKVE